MTRAQAAVADALAGPDFAGASRALEAVHAVSGTYVDAEVGGGALEVRWADAAGYCLEATTFDGTVEHLLGPHGRVARGPCPPTVG